MIKTKLYIIPIFIVFVVENLLAANFKVEYKQNRQNGREWDITATSLVNNITLNDVRVNRGNCKNDFNLRQMTTAMIMAKTKPTKEQENQMKIDGVSIGMKWREPKDLDYAEKYKKEILELKIQKHKNLWQDKDGICRLAKDWFYSFRELAETSEWSTSGTPEVQLSQEDIKKMEVAYKEYFCPAIEKVYEGYYDSIRENGIEESRTYMHKHIPKLEAELSKEENLQKILPKNVLGFSMREKCPLCYVDTCSDDDPTNFYSNRDKNRYCDYQFKMDDLQKLRMNTSLFNPCSSHNDCTIMGISNDIDRAIHGLTSKPSYQRNIAELKQLGVKFKRTEVPDEYFSATYPTLPPFAMIVDEIVEKPKKKTAPSSKPKLTLKYGQSVVFSVPLSCRILEVQLISDKGTETYNFK